MECCTIGRRLALSVMACHRLQCKPQPAYFYCLRAVQSVMLSVSHVRQPQVPSKPGHWDVTLLLAGMPEHGMQIDTLPGHVVSGQLPRSHTVVQATTSHARPAACVER